MKNLNIKTKFILSLIILLGMTPMLFASQPVVKVLVDKQFKVKKGVVLNATQEFGKVYCKNWSKSEISVKITAKISGDEADIQKVMSRIIAKVSGNENKVDALCKLSSSITKMVGQHLELKMEIMMPEWANLNLEHSFGSAWVGDLSGNLTLKSKYGSVTMGDLTGSKNKIDVSFGKAEINSFSNANVELSYGKMNLNKADMIVLDGEYSDLKVGSVKTLNADIEGGRFSLGSVDQIEGESSFTDVNIGQLNNSIKWNMNYGGISIDQVEAGFSMITLHSDFGTTRLGFAPGASGKLDVNVSNGKISLRNPNISVNSDIKEMFSHHIKGVLGKKKNTDNNIVVKANYGTVKIN